MSGDMNELFGTLFDDGPAVAVADEPEVAESVAEVQSPIELPEPKSVPSNFLFFDVECIPDYDREHLFDLPPIPASGPRTAAKDMMPADQLRTASLEEVKQVIKSKRPDEEYLAALEAVEKADKKPRKGLFDLIDEMRNESNVIDAAVAARKKKMGVTPEMCRIVSLGTAVGGDPTEARAIGPDEKDWQKKEADLLRHFWRLARNAKVICGFNSNQYDLPVIFIRSMMLGVEPSKRIDLTPWKGDTCDLMAMRWPKGGAMGLKVWAAAMGIPVPAGDTDGSHVEEMWKAGKIDELKEYNRSDVSITREIWRRGRGMWWV